MKLIKKLFAGSVLAAAVMSANASIILPVNGDGELTAILYRVDNNSSLVVDLGITISAFNTSLNQTFVLSASPYYSTFYSSSNPITFAVIAADSLGPNSGLLNSKQLYLTSSANSTPSAPSNSTLATRVGLVNTFQQALNGANGVTFNGTHSTDLNGSSLDTATGTATSFSTIQAGVISPSGITMVTAGSQAEFFAIQTSFPGGTTTAANVTDFFSGTETSTNLGGYFTLNAATGTLDYFGEPTVVNAIPEASEWAMMLSGLAMLGLMVRRRRNNA